MSEGIMLLLLGEFFSIIGLLVSNLLQNRSLKKQVKKDIQELKDHQKETYLSTLRLTVVSEEMPLAERIIAGKKYIEMGGNGDVKKIYQKMISDHTKGVHHK